MPDEVRVDRDRGLVHIRSVGPLTRETMESSLGQMLAAGRDHGIRKVLIDATRVEAVPGAIDIFKVMEAMPRDLRMAIVLGDDTPVSQGIRFGETVGRNRGRHVQVFAEREDALSWLDRICGNTGPDKRAG